MPEKEKESKEGCLHEDTRERRLLAKDKELLLIRNDGYLSVRRPICQKSSRSTHQPPSKLVKICG